MNPFLVIALLVLFQTQIDYSRQVKNGPSGGANVITCEVPPIYSICVPPAESTSVPVTCANVGPLAHVPIAGSTAVYLGEGLRLNPSQYTVTQGQYLTPTPSGGTTLQTGTIITIPRWYPTLFICVDYRY